MKSRVLPVRIAIATVLLSLAAALPSQAQSYEEQARVILSLYESGRTDTAYTLIEPLKTSARFVPAVIFARAQMTPDDRALALYKELIALEPGGDWADDAAFELVARYVAKSDSLAALTWLGVLTENYPMSSFVHDAEKLIASAWGKKAQTKSPSAKKAQTSKTTPAASPKTAQASTANAEPALEDDESMRGYALQVGLFPTRESALSRADELRRNGGIRAVPLPKVVNGQRQYALVVGPYRTIDAANERKSIVTTACDCQAFIVKVE